MPVSRNQKSSRRALRVLVWIAVQVVLVALLLEVALRIARPHHAGLNSLLYIPSVRTHFDTFERTSDLLAVTTIGYSPGEEMAGFVLNSRGFRTPEYTEERGDGLRVVALGDSFTYAAVPHSQSWPAQLEEVLRERWPDRGEIEVISLGVPGVGPQFYLRMWELEGRRLDPDLVVLGFFVGNDLVEESGLSLDSQLHGFLLQHSLAARAVRNGMRLLRSGGTRSTDASGAAAAVGEGRPRETGVEIDAWTRDFDPDKPTLYGPTFLEIETERMAVCLQSERDFLDQRLEQVGPVLLELDRAVGEGGAELVVLLIPDQFQVEDELLDRLLEDQGLGPQDIALAAPQQELSRFFDANHIRYVDVLKEFRARADSERLYLTQDTHWNAAGNRFAAELVAASLGAAGLESD